MNKQIQLVHGNGGKDTDLLIKEIFYKYFDNQLLKDSMDSAVFDVNKGKIAFTTDTFVVKPIFFPGGNIGKLAICGTINDLVVSGAKPLYLACGFIIEEGFEVSLLETIVKSMADVCKEAHVNIVTGDTKVVERGSLDGIFINTSGIGEIHSMYQQKPIQEGDQIIITGGIGEHGTTIGVERYHLKINGSVKSDCMPLNDILSKLQEHDYMNNIKLMKDPTRGGIATIMNEIAEYAGLAVHLVEEAIPIKREVKSVNQMLGLDPMYLASEGRMVLVVEEKASKGVLEQIRLCDGCDDAAIIGRFRKCTIQPIVYMETCIGGKRIIRSLEGEMLPRIC